VSSELERKMGIVKWWNDRKSKPTEAAQSKITGGNMIVWGPLSLPCKKESPATEEKPKEKEDGYIDEPPEIILSDIDRVTNYFAKGGEIVDISNKPRKDHDGFPPDQELLIPFNRAHQGTREGLAGMVRRKR
jgi:hypothetical protein